MDQVRHFDSLKQLCSKLWLFRTNGYLCDTTIATSDRELSAHSVILAAGSSSFYAAFSASSNDDAKYKIVIPHLSGDEVEIVLFCIYNGCIYESNEKQICVDDVNLKNLCDQFGIVWLKDTGDQPVRPVSQLNESKILCAEKRSGNPAEDPIVSVQLCDMSEPGRVRDFCSTMPEMNILMLAERHRQDGDLNSYNSCQPVDSLLKFDISKISGVANDSTLTLSCIVGKQTRQTECQLKQHAECHNGIGHNLSSKVSRHHHLQSLWTEHPFHSHSPEDELTSDNFVWSSGSSADKNNPHKLHRQEVDQEHHNHAQLKSFYTNELPDCVENGEATGSGCYDQNKTGSLEISSNRNGAFECRLDNSDGKCESRVVSACKNAELTTDKTVECSRKECGKNFGSGNVHKRCRTSRSNDACYVCYVCHVGFSQRYYLQKHLRRHVDVPKYACSLCGKAFKEKYLLRKHYLIHVSEKPYSCDICGRSFGQDYYLTKHRKRHSNEYNYACEYCGRAFKENYQLKKHVRVHSTTRQHPLKNSSRLLRNEKLLQNHGSVCKDGPVLSCEVCGKTFKTLALLTAHRESHTSKTSVSCMVCNLEFTALNELRQHEAAEHELVSASTCQCGDCGKLFAHVAHLKSHMQVHSEERPHVCSICQRSFRRHSDLRSHLLTHTGQKSHLCSVCGKGFLKKSDLKRHFQGHTDERPYVCDTCGKGFKVLSYLKEHIFIHSAEKRFVCPVCKKTFISLGNLKNHIKIHTGLKPHKCSVCEKEFLRLSNLKSHLKIHVKKPEPCSDLYLPLEQILNLEKTF